MAYIIVFKTKHFIIYCYQGFKINAYGGFGHV